MKISFCSDLHLEFGLLELENKDNADVLVLAGDVVVASNFLPKHEWFFENCASEFKDVIYIMGNHEHYHGDFQKTADILRKELEKFPNVHFLNNSHVTVDGVNFFGATMWTSMNDRDPYVMNRIAHGMNDFRIVDNGERHNPFTPRDAAIEFEKTQNALKLMLEAVKEFGQPDEKMVVVTHHAPSKKSIHPRYQNDSLVNYGYHSDLDKFIEDNPTIKLWVHGHTHSTFDYMIGETRVVCNPRGYIGYEDRANRFELVTVEI